MEINSGGCYGQVNVRTSFPSVDVVVIDIVVNVLTFKTDPISARCLLTAVLAVLMWMPPVVTGYDHPK